MPEPSASQTAHPATPAATPDHPASPAGALVELNELLVKLGVPPDDTLVMRHRPTEAALRDLLPWYAVANHALFNAYQRSQIGPQGRALGRSRFLVSLIGHAPKVALFVGVYRVTTSTLMGADEFYAIEENRVLQGLGSRGPTEGVDHYWADLEPTPLMQQWSGRLEFAWPSERSWWRQAGRNTIAVSAIHPESLLIRPIPDAQNLTITWHELQVLPPSWKSVLQQWRGIYLIFDTSDGKSYVGSAAGRDNIYGRWKNYASSGHGSNALLRQREPANFVFSILQRLSPDLDPAEVVPIEATWKRRLHTLGPHGLNAN